jgi:hypothetical protein
MKIVGAQEIILLLKKQNLQTMVSSHYKSGKKIIKLRDKLYKATYTKPNEKEARKMYAYYPILLKRYTHEMLDEMNFEASNRDIKSAVGVMKMQGLF